MTDHLIGLLLGAEDDWPRRSRRSCGGSGRCRSTAEHRFTSERLTIEPFDLTDPVRTDLVIDRLALLVLPPARVAQEGRRWSTAPTC